MSQPLVHFTRSASDVNEKDPIIAISVAPARCASLAAVALRLFLVLACTFLLFTSREPPWADAHVVYDTTQALVDHHELNVHLEGPPQFFTYRLGKKYGAFPLGNVVAMVPSYLAFKSLHRLHLFPDAPLFALCSHLSPALLLAAASAVFYGLSRRRGASPRLAALLTLGLGFSTLCFCYARSSYAEALQTLLLILVVHSTLRASEAPARKLPALEFLLLGLYAGALLNSKLVNALLLPPVPIYLVWSRLARARGEGRPAMGAVLGLIGPFLLALVGFVPLVALALWHNWLKTGSPWSAGYQIPNGVFSGDLLPALYGFLLSPGRSVFLYSPPLLLLVPALGAAWRQRRAETLFLGSLILIGLLWNSKFRAWHGDYCWGPRYLVPFIPLALLLLLPWLPAALERGRTQLRRALIVSLFVLGFGVQVLGSAFYWDHYIRMLIAVKDQTGASGWFLEQLGHGHYLPQFSPLRGHLWLLMHKLRKDPDLNRDAPWKLLVPQRFELGPQFQDLRYDWWLLDFKTPEAQQHPWALPLTVGAFGGGLLLGLSSLLKRLLATDEAR